MQKQQYEFGPQPFDEILQRHNLCNRDLVAASTEQITFKMVQKGRKGRRLTRRIQLKLLNALNILTPDDRQYALHDLFNY